MMKQKKFAFLVAPVWCLLATAGIFQTGCGRTIKAPDSHEESKAIKVAEQKPIDTAIETLRGGADLGRCQEAVKMVNAHLLQFPKDRPQAGKSTAARQLLSDTFGLTEDEIEYVNQNSFTTMDGYHLELCFRMRDVAEALRLRELPPITQAERGFAWAMRQVVLNSSSDNLLPPAYVLKRGQGTAQERALVFLALMQQMHMPGCMIAIPGKSSKEEHYRLAGILVEGDKTAKDKSAEIYLFDPYLGVPVPGPDGKGIATLRQFRRQPQLVTQLAVGDKAYDVTSAQAGKAEVCLVCPLSALSARMQFLEDKFNTKLHVNLAQPPEQLVTQFKNAAGEVHVWNDPAAKTSPTRALRLFLPKEQGGIGSPVIFQRLQMPPVAGSYVREQFQNMGILDGNLTPYAQKQLLGFTEPMLNNYIIEPRDKLTRGRWDQGLTKPIVQLQGVLRGFDRSKFHQDADFRHKEIAQWIDRVNQIYLAVVDKRPGAEQQINRLWGEDLYFHQLITPRRDGEDVDFRSDLPKTLLTYLVLQAVGEPLSKETDYVLALAWLEKAERAQQRIDTFARKKRQIPAVWKEEASSSWVNAIGSTGSSSNVVGYARRYVNRYSISRRAVADQLERIQESPAHPIFKVEMMDELLRDIHRCAALNLHIADSLVHAGDKKSALATLKDIEEELQEVLKNEALKKTLHELAGKVKEIPPEQAKAMSPEFQDRPRLLAGTLAEGGSLRWYLHAVQYRLKRRQE